uniref:Elongin-A n=1 Tax=Sciurus vulgaris TaxID=55149 RepID=A0A8D2DDC6_SCIVU
MSREEAEPGSVMAAEWVLQAVQKLQARLASSTRSKKLQKYLKKLSALPITPDILEETGVRKTVKSLRKQELVGDLARDLAAQWKKLALLERNPGPGPQDSEQSRSPKRPGDALRKEEVDRGYQEKWSVPRSPSSSPEQGQKAQRELWPPQRSRKRSHSREGRDESKKRPRVAAFPSGPLDLPQEKEDLLPKAKEISDNVMNQKGKLETSHLGSEGYGIDKPPQDSVWSRKHFDFVQNFPLMNGNQSEKWQPADVYSAEMEEFSTEAPPGLPDLSLPHEEATHSPPPTYDLMYFFQPDGTTLSSPEKEEEAGFTGCRKYSKMKVYSGSKCGHLAQMTSHQQCSQELMHNGSILEESGLPHSVLKKCAPDQLYCMEKYNQVSVEEADQLWRIHCHKEFKKEMPKENESWREMYLRLQDAQEQRLQALTRRIQSARTNKPQGRKTKMIFFKSPGDVPRRQEKFGTVAAAASEKAKFEPAQYPTGSSDTPSRTKRPTGASLNTGRAYLAPVVNIRKSTGKKAAPLMAKAIKDYNRRISRR